MVQVKRTMLALVFAGSLIGIQAQDTRNAKGEASDATPIATVKSSAGLIVNGVATPAGVFSVLVGPGDVIDTRGATAVATYKDGHTVTLSAGTHYSVSKRPGGAITADGPANGTSDAPKPQTLSIHK